MGHYRYNLFSELFKSRLCARPFCRKSISLTLTLQGNQFNVYPNELTAALKKEGKKSEENSVLLFRFLKQ